MKKMNLEQMTNVEGGISIDGLCQGFAVGVALKNGLSAGSAEWAIITNLAYSACWETYLLQ
ncbi:MAG: hypothetical protein RIA69_13920 [Cyclobacteriaceae bacterium]|uniref:hypothetical protein n=1 Tax=Fulvivirga sp. TaxID=1931237 RepID=UPI0032EBA144